MIDKKEWREYFLTLKCVFKIMNRKVDMKLNY